MLNRASCRGLGVSVWVALLLSCGPSGSAADRPVDPATAPGSDSQRDSGGLYQKSELPPVASSGLVRLTILSTNDIHGGVEPSKYRSTGEPIGGMSFWGGVIRSTRKAIESAGGRVLVLDAGDQFQGTLISNTNEGSLVFSAMDEVGYDAVVPGNHDYDFGPRGWLKDRATDPGENGREVIEGLAASVKFPLLSANTYLRASLKDKRTGDLVEVSSNACIGPGRSVIDWGRARRPDFLKPWLIRDFGGMKVAIIGMDHPSTASMTTAVNVSDLCFRDPLETYREIRDQIGDRADVFILVIHGANSPGKPELTQLVKAVRGDAHPRLDAVIAGHTHMIQKDVVDGVPIIQSGSGGERFGRIDFYFDAASRKLVPAKTEVVSGIALLHRRCDDSAGAICSVTQAEASVEGGVSAPSSGSVSVPSASSVSVSSASSSATPTYGDVAYDGIRVEASQKVVALITAARQAIQNLAGQKLLVAKDVLRRDRTRESPLADLLTDVLREAAGADLSFMNTGGIRSELPAGEVTYEQLFEVLPFGNRGVLAGPMRTAQVVRLLERSIKTCGDYGALMQSGLRVRFRRNCRSGGVDPAAELLTVETLNGQKIFDQQAGGIVLDRGFSVATLDFLLDGGSGFDAFKGTPVLRDLDIAREAIVRQLLQSPQLREVDGRVDGRWFEVRPPRDGG